MNQQEAGPYTGTDNLEIMAEAVNYNRFLISLIAARAKPGDRILDIGAGIGTFAKDLVARGFSVSCMEPDATQAALIKAAGLEVETSVDRFANDSFDYAYSLNVLEHIEDDGAALQLWRTKLKPGGRLLVYVPAFQILYSSMDRKVGHFRRYTRSGLAEKAIAGGFEIESLDYVDSLGFFASLVYKMIGSDTGDINREALIAYDRYVFPMSRVGDVVFGKLLGKNVVLTATNPVSL